MNATKIGQRHLRSAPLLRFALISLVILALTSMPAVLAGQSQDPLAQVTHCEGKSECTAHFTLEAVHLTPDRRPGPITLYIFHADNQVVVYVNGKMEYDSGITTNDPLIRNTSVPIHTMLITGRNVVDIVGVNLGGPSNFTFTLTAPFLVDAAAFQSPPDLRVGIIYRLGFVIDAPELSSGPKRAPVPAVTATP